MTPMYNYAEHLPHRGLEAWKWTDLKSAIQAHEPSGVSDALSASVGALDGLSVDQDEATEGLDAMSKMAAIFSGGATHIRVPDGASYEQPLVLTDLASGNGQIMIEIGKGASLCVEEHHESADGFINLDLRYVVREGGLLKRIVTTDDGDDVIRHVRAQVTLWDKAKFEQVILTTGSALTRLETRLACMGAVEATLSGAYMLSGKRHADITNYTDLTAPDCVIRDEVAGVVTDKARGVFQGKFHVRRPAQHTDAEMRHDALMLSETAKVNAKPELEIYADDVECAHGNTVGQLDENSLFYMRQRGIPLAQARALMLEAFLVAKLGGDETLAERVSRWLEAQS